MHDYAVTWRLTVTAMALALALPASAQSPDPFHSAPAPSAPIRPRTPEPANPIPAPSPQQKLAGPFDGTYLGTVTAATGPGGTKHPGRCLIGGPVKMVILSNVVAVEQGGRPDGGVATYHGTIDSAGTVKASAASLLGEAHTVSGSISGGKFIGQITRENCSFSITLLKQ